MSKEKNIITVQDCMDLYESGYEIHINDGKVSVTDPFNRDDDYVSNETLS